MNNEPVAWMEADVLPLTHIIKAVVRREQDEQHTIPLYTYPAKETNYKFGVDWGKNDKSVTVVKIHEDGVAEIVFVDYQERTHPAKTLTDEEIGQIWKDCMELAYMQVSNPVGFARAILKKASEK